MATHNQVYELLAWGCGLPLMTAISEAPRSSALNFFNFVVAPRGVRADSTWAILESALSESVLPRVLDRDEVYQVLTATVRQSADLPLARYARTLPSATSRTTVHPCASFHWPALGRWSGW